MNLQPAAVASVVITLVGALAIYQPQRYAAIGDQTGYSPAQPIDRAKLPARFTRPTKGWRG